jgi:ketosteroid isomerase-like protein
MSRERNIEAVREGFAAFNRRDFDGALASLHDDVTWERFLSRAETDEPLVRGKEELRRIWESQVEALDLRFETEEFTAVGDDQVLVSALATARGSGSEITLSVPVTWLCTLDEDGCTLKVEVAGDGEER